MTWVFVQYVYLKCTVVLKDDNKTKNISNKYLQKSKLKAKECTFTAVDLFQI